MVTNDSYIHKEEQHTEFGEPLLPSSKKYCLSVCSLKTQIKIRKTIILPVVLYGRGTWSLAFKEEHLLWVSERSAKENMWT
jgi:hypothetical protein